MNNIELNYLIAEAINTTEKAAIESYFWVGKGDEHNADDAAVKSMRDSLNKINFSGRVVIGEGERDKAPMLFIGEKVGKSNSPIIDIALDPLEGTKLCANNLPNSLSILAFGSENSFLHAPDVYMSKIAIGKNLPKDLVDLNNSPKQNLLNLAKAKKCDISDIKVVVLNRPRHKDLISYIKEAGANLKLINDGDVAASIATILGNKCDMYIGIGGAPEGVLAAAALKCLAGQFLGKLIFEDKNQENRAKSMGITDLNKIYSIEDLIKSDVIFSATGVTDGDLVEGVKYSKDFITTQTICMNNINKDINKITKYIPL